MKDLVEIIIKYLVDKPEDVKVSEVVGSSVTILEVRVAKEDIGKVIGKQGQTAKAIRTLLNAISAKLKKHVVLEILE